MKITRISVQNIIGVNEIDVKLPTAVTLFAGRNGSAKSSLADAVKIAIGGEGARGAKISKAGIELVREGQPAGGAVVTINDDPDTSFSFNMPGAVFAGPEINESMRVALDGQRFAQMAPDERRTFLSALSKIKVTAALVRQRMLERKCEEAKVDAVLPMLRTGFPSVCEHAKKMATTAKGAWRAITGATYGPKAAEKWAPEMPEAPKEDRAALAARATELDELIAVQNQALGTITQTVRTNEENATKRAGMKATAEQVPSLVEQIELQKDDLAEYEAKVIKVRERAAGKRRIGLVHELAMFLVKIDIPSLGKETEDSANDLIKRYEKEHGTLAEAAAAQVDTEAQASLPALEQGLTVMKNRLTNLQRDLDSAKQVKGQYDALEPAGDVTDGAAEIAEVRRLLDQSKEERRNIESVIKGVDEALRQRTEAVVKTKSAALQHAEVAGWTLVADALAPDGIPAELLDAALAPINSALEQAALDTEWMRVEISKDMQITAGGRAYQFLSESEQWRTDAMIAQVVSELSGLKVLLLDRVDVLDLPGRSLLLSWLDMLVDEGLLDSALLFATLKANPTALPPSITSFWVESGNLLAAAA